MWDEQKTKLLVTMWGEGHSASKIANEIPGKTRNAVIGKVHRLKLPARAPRQTGKPRRYPRERVRPRWTAPKTIHLLQLHERGMTCKEIAAHLGGTQNRIRSRLQTLGVEPVATRPASQRRYTAEAITGRVPDGVDVRFLDLESGRCKWPVEGEPGPDMLCCGANVMEGKPYCAHHAAAAYRPLEARGGTFLGRKAGSFNAIAWSAK